MNTKKQLEVEPKKTSTINFNKIPEAKPKEKNVVVEYLKNYWIMFSLVAVMFVAAYYIKNYEAEHPITCDTQGTVKELISIEGSYANIKLQDDTMVKYQISRSNGKSGRYYGAAIKPNDVICLGYSRK